VKYLLLIAILISSQICHAQNEQLQIIIGRSLHGTGDMRGFGLSFGYSKYFKKRFSWTASIGSTIHDGLVYRINYEYPVRVWNDGSLKSTTAGLQGIFSIGYSFLKSHQHEMCFKIGGLVRYQSSSYYDQVQVLYPGITGLPYPVLLIKNSSPQKTLSVGLMPELSYNYSLSKKINIGLAGAYLKLATIFFKIKSNKKCQLLSCSLL
jgi:hypothetical protein